MTPRSTQDPEVLALLQSGALLGYSGQEGTRVRPGSFEGTSRLEELPRERGRGSPRAPGCCRGRGISQIWNWPRQQVPFSPPTGPGALRP